MKKLLLYTTVFLALGNSGCKKFLEKPPDNRAELRTPAQVSQLLGTAYPKYNYQAFLESSSDNVADKGVGEVETYNTDPYHFMDVRDDQQDTPEAYWNSCYAAVAVANQALEACNTASNPQAYTAQKGEALVARAYAHFMLVTLYADLYDPATAGSKPGIPYVTEPENVVIKKYERKTVAYVYEMIEKDLLAGMPLLDDKTYTVPRYHFTRAAANAFAARFYLFKQDYQKVVDYANAVFTTSAVTNYLRPWNTTYLTYTYRELFAAYYRATEPANLLLSEAVSWWGRYYTLRYGLTSAKRNEIIRSNVTGGAWSFANHVYTVGSENYLIPKINELFVRNSVNADIGTGYVMVPLFTAEEVLFNRAEAYTYLNNTTAALADLNTYASTRINNYNPVTHEITADKIGMFYNAGNLQAGIIRTILDFKRAEYVQEGMRWFDILRYKIPVTHLTAEGETLTLGPDSPMRLFQIPQSAKLSDVDQNPR